MREPNERVNLAKVEKNRLAPLAGTTVALNLTASGKQTNGSKIFRFTDNTSGSDAQYTISGTAAYS